MECLSAFCCIGCSTCCYTAGSAVLKAVLPFTVQEDGLQKAVEAFHRHLPLEKLTTDKPVNWHLAKPHFVNIVSEVGRGLVGVVSEPVRGYREGGELLMFLFSSCSPDEALLNTTYERGRSLIHLKSQAAAGLGCRVCSSVTGLWLWCKIQPQAQGATYALQRQAKHLPYTTQSPSCKVVLLAVYSETGYIRYAILGITMSHCHAVSHIVIGSARGVSAQLLRLSETCCGDVREIQCMIRSGSVTTMHSFVSDST